MRFYATHLEEGLLYQIRESGYASLEQAISAAKEYSERWFEVSAVYDVFIDTVADDYDLPPLCLFLNGVKYQAVQA